MVRLKSCVREVSVLSNRTTIPPPSTVSMVRASRLGVSASKSCIQGHTGRQFNAIDRNTVHATSPFPCTS